MKKSSKTYKGLENLKNRGFEPSAIVDIGAYDGVWSESVREVFPSSRILMIDALLEKAIQLRKVSRKLGNAEFDIALLGESEEEAVEFFVVNAGAFQTGSSKYRENTTYPKQMRQLAQKTIDQLLLSHQYKFDFVKIDAQGAELDILAGGRRLMQHAEAILLEVATLPYNENSPQFYDVVSKMKNYGYVIFDILDDLRLKDGTLFQCDILFVKETSGLRPTPPY